MIHQTLRPLLVLIFGLFLSSARAQADEHAVGSATTLEGKIYVLTVFVTSGTWTTEEKTQEYRKIFEAQNWLIKQARRYDKKIAFDGGNFGMREPFRMADMPAGTASGNEPTDLVSRVLLQLGYTSPMQFTEWVQQNTDCNHALVLILSDLKGIGYAMAYREGGDADKYFTEGCILYRNFPDGRPMSAAGIAHEFLHIFGAWDLYANFRQSHEQEQKARELFPDDIMLRTSYKIDELVIDRLTAWRVGLSQKQEAWYEWFRPAQ